MNSPETEDLVAGSEVFRRLPAEGRHRLLEVGKEVEHPAKAAVVSEGEEALCFFVVLSGELVVSAEALDGKRKEIDRLFAGSVFGEIGVLTAEPRTATVTSLTEVKLLEIEILALLGVLKDYPDVLADLKRLGLARSEELLHKTV